MRVNLQVMWLGIHNTPQPFHCQYVADYYQHTRNNFYTKLPVNYTSQWYNTVYALMMAGF